MMDKFKEGEVVIYRCLLAGIDTEDRLATFEKEENERVLVKDCFLGYMWTNIWGVRHITKKDRTDLAILKLLQAAKS